MGTLPQQTQPPLVTAPGMPQAGPPPQKNRGFGGLVPIVALVELALCAANLVLILVITYPLYVMTDRTTPSLRFEPGVISTATLAFIVASVSAGLVLCAKLKPLGFPKPHLALVAFVLLYVGACDLANRVRFQRRMHKNEDKYGDEDNPNRRAYAIVTLIWLETIIAFLLLLTALITAPEAPAGHPQVREVAA